MSNRKRSIRREQLIGLAWGIPFSILANLLSGWLGYFSDNVWGVAAALLPLALVTWFLGRPLLRDRRLVLGGGFLPFFICYVLLFSLAATSELLNGRRIPLLGYEDAVPRNFLGLGWLEDWHYKVARPAGDADSIVVVLLPELPNVNESRLRFASLIRNAVDHGALGIAFDYYMESESDVDRVLCLTIGQAAQANVKVLFGYRLEEVDGGLTRRPLPSTLEACLSETQLGSLSGYRESDGLIRMVPLFVEQDISRPAISYRIAAELNPNPPRRERTLVQFARTRSLPIIEIQDQLDEADLELLRDRFVIVGSSREGDRHLTPYGELPGVVLHAYTAHGVHSGEFIRRLDPRWTFPIVFIVCFVLVGVQARGGRKQLFAAAALFTVAILAGCALVMFGNRLWVDASYPVVAIWGMTVLLQGGAAAQRGRLAVSKTRTPKASREAVSTTEVFDVFLSHNGEDKDAVRTLAEALDQRGLKVWLDERELPPGRPWQEEIERVIETVRSAAILVGPNGLGPWEIVEMRACLVECVRRDMPVIPILLPGTPEEPKLPAFLKSHTWVDLRKGVSPEGLDRVEWGITGINPAKHLIA